MTNSMNGKYAFAGMNHRGSEQYVRELEGGAELVLEREPTNKFDRNAIRITHAGKHVAYVKAVQARALAMAMDSKGLPTITAKLVNNNWPCAVVKDVPLTEDDANG